MDFSPGIKVPEHDEVLLMFKAKLVTFGADKLFGEAEASRKMFNLFSIKQDTPAEKITFPENGDSFSC